MREELSSNRFFAVTKIRVVRNHPKPAKSKDKSYLLYFNFFFFSVLGRYFMLAEVRSHSRERGVLLFPLVVPPPTITLVFLLLLLLCLLGVTAIIFFQYLYSPPFP